MRFLFALILTSLVADAAGQPMMPGDPSFLQSTSSLRKGLVGYWRLEEASGTRYDCSPAGNHLTANNSPGQAAGKVGNCATFVRGSFTSLSLPTNALAINSYPNWTCATWVKLTVTNDAFVYLIAKDNAGSKREFGFGWTGAQYFVFVGNGLGSFTGPTYFPTGIEAANWNFITFGVDSGVQFIRANLGTRQTTSLAFTPGNSDNPLVLGSEKLASAGITGEIDETGFWSRVLTSAEESTLYNSGLGTHFPWAHP